jgi:hypothetical protein
MIDHRTTTVSGGFIFCCGQLRADDGHARQFSAVGVAMSAETVGVEASVLSTPRGVGGTSSGSLPGGRCDRGCLFMSPSCASAVSRS